MNPYGLVDALLLVACSLNQQNFINAICFHRGGLDLDPASSAR